MFEYEIFARKNTPINRCRCFTIKATDENEAHEKFKEEHPGWILSRMFIESVSIREELKDFLKSHDDPVMVEILRSALKIYDEATKTDKFDKMTEAIEITKNILMIILPNCSTLKHLIEREPDRIIMSDVEIVLKELIWN